jgi:hypothetical protein
MSPGTDQIPAELSQYTQTNCIWNKEKFPEQRKEPVIVRIYKKCDTTECQLLRIITVTNCIQNRIQRISVKVHAIRTRNYWG